MLALGLAGHRDRARLFYMQWAVDGAVVSADRDLLTVLGLGFLLLTVDPGRSDRRSRSWVVLYLSTTLNLQWLAQRVSRTCCACP